MSIVKLNTGFNIEVDFSVAPFHKRLLAWLIDGIIIIAYLLIAHKIITTILGYAFMVSYGWVAVLYSLPYLLYHLLCECFLNGQSPGKKALNIKVITTEGGQPTFSQYMLRWLFKIIDFPFWIFFAVVLGGWPWFTIMFVFMGLICFATTARSQRIGDLVAGTMIINTKSTTTWHDTVFTNVEENYVPQFPQVMKLTDRDMNTIKQVLNNLHNKNQDHVFRIVERIKMVLQVQTELDAREFLRILLKDYNHLSSK
jgi:uncharacterized RDD family membrane protein YckC